jgi:hypothetical protein
MANNTGVQNMSQLINILGSVNGSSFVSIDTLTSVTLRGGKANPFQGRVTKRMTGASVMVFQNKKSNAYDNMVKRRLVAEGKDPESFKLGERAFGTRIPETPFIEHIKKDTNGKQFIERYLEVIFLKAGTTELLVDGQPYSGEIPGLPEDREPTGQGGLENQVIIRTYKCDSIKKIRIDKQEYVL